MFSKLALFATASMAVFVTAIPTPGNTPSGGVTNSCNTGTIQCCNNTLDSQSAQASQLLGLLGIVAGVTGLVGLDCSPIQALALGGTSCSAQSVCCSNNHFSGAVAVGCTPINLNV